LRYAILFSGMSFRRHVNGLELCYRTLVDRLGFEPGHIRILNYDGSRGAYGDPPEATPLWPGDATPWRMPVSGPGNRHAFQLALGELELTEEDELFINTMGHGGDFGGPDGPDLFTYPHCQRYRRDDFCADLKTLGCHRSLTLLMGQCFSGGFIQAVLAASPAAATYVATAAGAGQRSFADLRQPEWDAFQLNWITAIADNVTLHEAFEYATRPGIAHPDDTPQSGAQPAWAGTLKLR
jgi:Peptidase C13 family